eukprot:7464167-Pyramimonas_sp.AAC.1
MAQESPKMGPNRAPRKPQESPRALQEGSRRRFLGFPKRWGEYRPSPSLIDILQDGSTGASKAPKSAPRLPKRRPGGRKRLPQGSQVTPKRPQEYLSLIHI